MQRVKLGIELVNSPWLQTANYKRRELNWCQLESLLIAANHFDFLDHVYHMCSKVGDQSGSKFDLEEDDNSCDSVIG